MRKTPEMTKTDSRFVIIEKEKVKEEPEISKPHNAKSDAKKKNRQNGEIKLLGQYEIIREEEELTPCRTPNQTKDGLDASSVSKSNNGETVTAENTINKITITVY